MNLPVLTFPVAQNQIRANVLGNKKKKISEEATLVVSKIEEIKKMILVINSGNANEAIDDKGNIDIWKIKHKESSVGIDEYYLNELKALIIKYRETLLTECSNDKQLADYISQTLDTGSECQTIMNGKNSLQKTKYWFRPLTGLTG